MSASYERFIQRIRESAAAPNTDDHPLKAVTSKLQNIEFTADPGHPDILASAVFELGITTATTDPAQRERVVSTYMNIYDMAIDVLFHKAVEIAQDRGVKMTKAGNVDRGLWRRNFIRAIERASIPSGDYADFVTLEHFDGKNLESFVTVLITAHLVPRDNPKRYVLVFTGVSRGMRYDPERDVYVAAKLIETLF